MTSILISGYYGFGNTGDEAMLKATIRGLKKRLGAVDITVVSGRPEAVMKEHPVKAIARLDLGAIRQAMQRSDLFLSGGGSLLQDATSFRNLAYHLGLFVLARRSRTPAMIFAQGVGPIRTRIGRAVAPWAMRGLAAITVRDPASADEFRRLGVTDPTPIVTADPAFALEPCSVDRAEAILRAARLGPGRPPLLAIAPRGLRHRELEAASLAFVADWAARRLKVRPLLIPMQQPNDVSSCRMILGLMKQPGEATVLDRPMAPEEVLGVIGRCEAVVGVRLHALIFAAATGVPLVGVEYDPKVAAFLDRLGLTPAATIETLSRSREDLVLGLERVWAGRDAVRQRLASVAAELSRLAEQNFDIAAAIAGGGGA